LWLLKKLKINLPYDPAIPLLGIYPKEYESGYNKSTCTSMFIVAFSQWLSCGNSQDAPQLMNGLRKCGIYTHWNFTPTKKNFKPQKRMKFCHSQVNRWNWRT
jgi:hypothetical protein